MCYEDDDITGVSLIIVTQVVKQIKSLLSFKHSLYGAGCHTVIGTQMPLMSKNRYETAKLN